MHQLSKGGASGAPGTCDGTTIKQNRAANQAGGASSGGATNHGGYRVVANRLLAINGGTTANFMVVAGSILGSTAMGDVTIQFWGTVAGMDAQKVLDVADKEQD